MDASNRFRLFSATVAAALVGCGGAPAGPPRGAVSNTRSSDTANVAQQATEPRTGDATAARPTPMNPTAGTTATVASSAPASSTSPSGDGSAPPPASAAKSDGDAPSKIGARHVLIQWMGSERAPSAVVRSREQALAVAQAVLKRARNKEDFARLAIEYSDEPGAGGRGGSLGRFGRGQMVGAFEAAVFKLEVGQISDIVETPFGFHIIQRTE